MLHLVTFILLSILNTKYCTLLAGNNEFEVDDKMVSTVDVDAAALAVRLIAENPLTYVARSFNVAFVRTSSLITGH